MAKASSPSLPIGGTRFVRECAYTAAEWARALRFFAARAVDGVERVEGGVYRRAVLHDGVVGIVALGLEPGEHHLRVTLDVPGAELADGILARARRLLDAEADVDAIAAHLARDPWLAPVVERHRPLRVLGGWSGFEIAARAVLGQQVSVAGARTLNGRLVERCGTRLGDRGDLRALYPTPEQVREADLSALGMPGARARALHALADAALADPALFDGAGSIDATVARLSTIRGVGEWTAHYVAMRACRDPDAFPASDIGLLRGAAGASGRPTPVELRARAEAWRPWRSYAAQYLWEADAARGV